MLLMKERNFLYELRAYLIYVKVGEIPEEINKKSELVCHEKLIIVFYHFYFICYLFIQFIYFFK